MSTVPSPPVDLRFQNITLKELVVLWSPPEFPNGVILQYELKLLTEEGGEFVVWLGHLVLYTVSTLPIELVPSAIHFLYLIFWLGHLVLYIVSTFSFWHGHLVLYTVSTLSFDMVTLSHSFPPSLPLLPVSLVFTYFRPQGGYLSRRPTPSQARTVNSMWAACWRTSATPFSCLPSPASDKAMSPSVPSASVASPLVHSQASSNFDFFTG